ncbi:MAG: tetratricopeptide repeat protein [Alphaproteobacteria bacterium]
MVTIQESLALAMEHHRAGRLAVAESMYDAILALAPDHVETLYMAGQAARSRGDREKAMNRLRQAFAQGSGYPTICADFGQYCLQLGACDEAIAPLTQATTLKPGDPEPWYLLGVAHNKLKHRDNALSALDRAVKIMPLHYRAWFETGLVLKASGRPAEAVACFRRTARIAPEIPEVWVNLMVTLMALGRNVEAIAPARYAARLLPTNLVVINNLAICLEGAGRLAEATRAFERAVALRPDDLPSVLALANHLNRIKRCDETLKLVDAMLARLPQEVSLHIMRGSALRILGRQDEAVASFRRAVILDPASVDGHNGIGTRLGAPNREVSLRRALAIEPRFAEGWSNLGGIYRLNGDLDEAVACFRKALAINPDHSGIRSNLLLTLCYHHGTSQEQLLAEHLAWAAIHEAPHLAATRARVWANDRDPDRRLRIGYVSGDFLDHAATFFLLPLLMHHDHERVHVTGYAQVHSPDHVTRHLQTLTDAWVDATPLSDDALFEKIQSDRIDILIDASGHTGHNRLVALARKPAPIQAHWLGYGFTSGMESMDYFITDPYAVRPDEERWFTETVWRLPKVMRTFTMIVNPPPVAPLPMRRRGRPAFGSMNAFVKVTEETLEVWANLLRRVPDAVMVVMGVASPSTVEAAFARHGIGPERLEFVERLSLMAFVQRITERVDVALDPFPHTGGTTSFHTLYMGVPIITMNGQHTGVRASVATVSAIGLPELVATSPDEYVDKAAALVNNPDRLERMRMELRDRMERSPFMDYRGFASTLEDAYRSMWHKWLDREKRRR